MEYRHDIKLHKRYFDEVASGNKTFEIRENDRDYQRGDKVLLLEYDPYETKPMPGDRKGLTGRKISAKIGFVSTYEQQPNFVVLSLLDIKIWA